jgi:hypothetical protein
MLVTDVEVEFIPQKYYIIDRAPDRLDSENRKYILLAQTWLTTNDTEERKADWCTPYYMSSIPIYNSGAGMPADTSSGYGNHHVDHRHTWKVKWTTNGGDFTASALEIDGMSLASLAVIDGTDMDLSDEMLEINSVNVAAGKIIRGHNATAKTSLGKLIHDTYDAGYTTATCETMGRGPYFQWGHGIGIWVRETSGYQSVFNGGTFRIFDRQIHDLASPTYIHAFPAMVISTPEGPTVGAKIKFESTRGGDSWEYTTDGSESQPTLITTSMGTPTSGLHVFDRSGTTGNEEITISCLPGTTGEIANEVLIHTVSLWPGYSL